MTEPTAPPSYRALLGVPSVGRILLAAQIARIAQSMVGVALVLFVLARYGSPALAGLVTFASIFPGLLASPVAGALLDRHGRVRLVLLDYLVALSAFTLLGALALADALAPPLLIAIATVGSLTSVLSHSGLRSLFPAIVPPHLWERVNALDSNGYLVATILGPPAAAALVAVAGGPLALIAVGAAFGLAALVVVGVPDPVTPIASTGRLLVDAWLGVRYTWSNPTLRGLGASIAVLNVGGGMLAILIPLIVLDRLHQGEVVVGLVFAMSGLFGVLSAIVFGRLDTRGREWHLLVAPMLLLAPVFSLLLPATEPGLTVAGVTLGVTGALALVAVSQALWGALTGPMDVAIFTVRQRRTDPAWTGRAFSVSMAFNYLGVPIGAAVGGVLATISLQAALGLGVACCLAGGLLAATLVPRRG